MWFIFGLLLGFWGLHCVHNVYMTLVTLGTTRMQVLLLRYHDAYYELVDARDGDDHELLELRE